MIDTVKVV